MKAITFEKSIKSQIEALKEEQRKKPCKFNSCLYTTASAYSDLVDDLYHAGELSQQTHSALTLYLYKAQDFACGIDE